MLDLNEISRIEKVGCPGLNGNWLKGDSALVRTIKIERIFQQFAKYPISVFNKKTIETGKRFTSNHMNKQLY